MNALGNRHVPSNIRILVVNNGLGFEMKFPASWGYSIANSIGVSEDNYVCAAGHYSSPDLIKSYVYGLEKVQLWLAVVWSLRMFPKELL